jgi:L-ascorbate metabolism protein UlaG (beta-lactamase superfamily)
MTCKIKNPTNAFVHIEFGETRIVIDPWVKSGLYYGGWSLFPEIENQDELLKNATHLYISHLHEDHCDPQALAKLNKKIKAYIPNVYGAKVLTNKLQNAGLEDITFLDPVVPVEVSDDIYFEVIPALNGFGQESDHYIGSDSLIDLVAIDTGLIVTSPNHKLIFLADNTPYLYKRNQEVLAHIKSADLIAFPYNGAASDYPVCYTNIDTDEMIEISNKREAKRELALLEFFEETSPLLLMPYSSDFAVIGKAAERYSKFSGLWWVNKNSVAERYAVSTGISTVGLSNNDLLFLSKKSGELEYNIMKGPRNLQSLEEFSRELIEVAPLVNELFRHSGADLAALSETAAEHMFISIAKLKIKCDWIFLVSITDLLIDIAIDMSVASVVNSYDRDRKILNVRLNSGFYEALLNSSAHWNNAQLSFQLEWIRSPNIYSHDLYTAINFFHLPRNKS